MGYDIGNAKRQMHLNAGGWTALLQLAHDYGWKPQGTTASSRCLEASDRVWNGNYTSNDGQIVEAEDARAMAEALRRALRDFPEKPPRSDGLFESADRLPAASARLSSSERMSDDSVIEVLTFILLIYSPGFCSSTEFAAAACPGL